MPNPYKGKQQYKPRSPKLPDNEPGKVLRRFLDETPSEIYDGPLGNEEFAKILGYAKRNSIASTTSQWIGGKPIPSFMLYKIVEKFSHFPIEAYMRAYVENPKADNAACDSFRLVLLLLERYQAGRSKFANEFGFTPGNQPSSENPLELLNDPMNAFENEWLADKSRHESPDPTRLERDRQKETFRKAVSGS